MTISAILTLEAETALEQNRQDNPLPCYALEWRQGELLVSLTEQPVQLCSVTFRDMQGLVNYLKRSQARSTRIDPTIGEAALGIWANACKQANKLAFLQLPAASQLPKREYLPSWWFKRLFDWVAALLLLIALGPAFLVIALLVVTSSPGPIFFHQWRVGERGKLFKILKFRTMVVNAEQMHHQVMQNQAGLHKCEDDPRITPVGRWLRKFSLDELPQLFNVLRGEMSLVGPRPWAIYDATRLSLKGQQRLNALPGITGPWQVGARSTLLDLEAVNRIDLEYLQSWSLGRDLKILLLTIPKVIVGYGAC